MITEIITSGYHRAFMPGVRMEKRRTGAFYVPLRAELILAGAPLVAPFDDA